jgi:hypothetical protein
MVAANAAPQLPSASHNPFLDTDYPLTTHNSPPILKTSRHADVGVGVAALTRAFMETRAHHELRGFTEWLSLP